MNAQLRSQGYHAKIPSLPSYCIAIARRPGNVSAVVVVRLLAVYRGFVLRPAVLAVRCVQYTAVLPCFFCVAVCTRDR